MRIMAMVEDGLGVSILPALILRRCQFDVAVRPLEGIPIGRSMRYIARLTFRLLPPVSSNTSKRVHVIVRFGQISEFGTFSYEIELSNEVRRYTAC